MNSVGKLVKRFSRKDFCAFSRETRYRKIRKVLEISISTTGRKIASSTLLEICPQLPSDYTTPISDDCAFPSPLSEAKPINTTTSTNNPRTKLNSNSEISIASDTPSSVANSSCQTEDFLLTQASTHTKPASDYQTSTPTNRTPHSHCARLCFGHLRTFI